MDFFQRVYRSLRGKPFRLLREDFCGTAALACAFVARDPANRAWGVDLDGKTLEWARRHRLARLREVAERVRLERRDVRHASHPKVDVVVAFNFSYWVFKRREDLRDYFRAVRRSLRPGGVFFANAFGGTEAMAPLVEKRRIAATQTVKGERLAGFTYTWEHKAFNPVTHDFLCYIHFKLADGTELRRAFRYDWRFWTLPEIREVMAEAGFARSDVYVEGWDETRHKPDEVYRRRKKFDNQDSWLAVVVGVA